MLVRALAAESGVPLLSMHSSALESKWFGESSKLLSAAFHVARTELAPCIVFFDEIDGFGRTRCDADQSCVYSFKCELLRNMDGIQDVAADAHTAVVVFACTNCVRSLDPALRRRFTKVVEIDRPSEAERLDILCKLSLGGSGKGGDGGGGGDTTTAAAERELTARELCRLRRVARQTDQLTGAELAMLFADASAQRMHGIEPRLGAMRSGAELAAALGPITSTHWRTALQTFYAARAASRPFPSSSCRT
jgi:SpoVK/Ycf46/Vps4 family AAA+-type ATPase